MNGGVTPLPTDPSDSDTAPSVRHITRIWWPIALSWILIGIETPMIIAFVARLPDPEVNLAAHGGIVVALTYAIESPLLAILTASAAMCKDWVSFRRVRKFVLWGMGSLTFVHALITLTPLYYLVTEKLIAAPGEIVQPGRLGLVLTLPYLSAVAYRRFNQGMLIRFGRSDTIAVGTMLRLLADAVVLIGALLIGSIPGVLVGAATMTVGVSVEAIWAMIAARRVIKEDIEGKIDVDPPPTVSSFLRFYAPLAITNMAWLMMLPVTSAALSRMPNAIVSLAVWPAITGVMMILSSGGTALIEVVVTVLDRLGAFRNLRRFSLWLAAVTCLLTFTLAATPLAEFWFDKVSGLTPALLEAARQAIWLALPIPGARVLQGFFQGVLAHARDTWPVTEAVIIALFVSLAILGIGVATSSTMGIFVGVTALGADAIVKTAWMWHRSRAVRRTSSPIQPATRSLPGAVDVATNVPDSRAEYFTYHDVD
jgi:hypothetical protein